MYSTTSHNEAAEKVPATPIDTPQYFYFITCETASPIADTFLRQRPASAFLLIHG